MATHGGAMGTVLGALAELGYGLAYRVLDAQYLGVAQQRRRVFIVGRLGDWAAPAEVLLEPEGRAGNPPARRAARTDLAGTLGSGAGGNRRLDLDTHGAYVANALTADGVGVAGPDESQAQAGHLVTVPTTAHALTAREGKGPDSDATSGALITHTLTAEGADASEDGTGRGTPLVPMAFNPQTAGDMRLGYRPTPSALHGGQQAAVQTVASVRRLSPRECERLQGFPDDWTRHRLNEAGRVVEQADAPRYRQMGNAVAVPVVQWIANRITRLEGTTAAA